MTPTPTPMDRAWRFGKAGEYDTPVKALHCSSHFDSANLQYLVRGNPVFEIDLTDDIKKMTSKIKLQAISLSGDYPEYLHNSHIYGPPYRLRAHISFLCRAYAKACGYSDLRSEALASLNLAELEYNFAKMVYRRIKQQKRKDRSAATCAGHKA